MPRVEQDYQAITLEKEIVNGFQTSRYQSAEVPYKVFEAADEDTAVAAVQATAPRYFLGMRLRTFSVSDRLSGSSWRINANYQYNPADDPTPPEMTFNFDTTGGSKHITHSIRTVSLAAGSPNYQGAINFDGEKVNGVTISSSIMSYNETQYYHPSVITNSWLSKLLRMGSTVNSTTFLGYEPGEILFVGATGSRMGVHTDDLWEVNYKFNISPNATDIQVGSMVIPSKRGWDLLWVHYQNVLDSTNKYLASNPIGVYVEQVYEYADLNDLWPPPAEIIP